MEYSLAIGEMTIHALKLPTNKHHVLAVKFDDEDCLYKVALFRTEADARWFMECLAEQLELGRAEITDGDQAKSYLQSCKKGYAKQGATHSAEAMG